MHARQALAAAICGRPIALKKLVGIATDSAGVLEIRHGPWGWVRTKIRNLLNLGVSLKTTIQHGASSKCYRHMARTPALQQALSNAWLKAQGLVSVKDLWCKAQGCTT